MRLAANPLRLLRDFQPADPLVLAFHGDRLLLQRTQDDAGVGLPTVSDLEGVGIAGRFPIAVGEIDGIPIEARDVPDLPELSDDWRQEGVRALFGIVDEQLFSLIGRGAHLIHWRRTSEHCGVCGSVTELGASEPAVRCPACGYSVFPRISPAVVVLVEDGTRCLLACGSMYQTGLFSCIAGFVEPGETLEQAVRREVREEVGLELDDLRYFASQPWPYPDGIMIGFHARAAGGTLRLRDGELEEARWFDVTELPMIPGSFSLARQLIDDFRSRVGAAPD